MEVSNPVGRPAKYNTPEELAAVVADYFEYIKGSKKDVMEDGEKVGEEYERYPENSSITGLAYHLGFESRQSFYDYEKEGEFSYIIKRARLRVEMGYEQRLDSKTPTGAIFALKNMGWKDKTEQDITTDGQKLNSIQVEVITVNR